VALATVAWEAVLMIRPDGRLTPVGRFIAELLTTLAAPLLLGYVIHAVRGARFHSAWFLPFAIHSVAALAFGPRLNAHISLFYPILLEYAYMVLTWGAWFRYAKPRSGHLAVLGVLLAVTAGQLGQIAGILDFLGYFHYPPLRQASLVLIGSCLAVAVVIALTESPRFRSLTPSRTPSVDAAERALFIRIDQLMRDARPWLDPDFDVGAMARLLGTYSNAVSKALGRAGGTSFYDYVNEYRVREAQRLLTDPMESRFKVEALGRQAGFRARSTFFKLFRQHTGLTPSEYRASQAAGPQASSSPSAP
jgi:AraC-like DNA-binding protein